MADCASLQRNEHRKEIRKRNFRKRIASRIRQRPWAGLQKNLPMEKNPEKKFFGSSADAFLRSSFSAFAVYNF
jgi:hypothetical protein